MSSFCALRNRLGGKGEYHISGVSWIPEDYKETILQEPFITQNGIPLVKDVINVDYKIDPLPPEKEEKVTTPLRKSEYPPVLRRKSIPLPQK